MKRPSAREYPVKDIVFAMLAALVALCASTGIAVRELYKEQHRLTIMPKSSCAGEPNCLSTTMPGLQKWTVVDSKGTIVNCDSDFTGMPAHCVLVPGHDLDDVMQAVARDLINRTEVPRCPVDDAASSEHVRYAARTLPRRHAAPYLRAALDPRHD